MVLTGLICGHTTWTSITEFGHYTLKWLRKHMPYKDGLPTRHNVARIILMIKLESLNELLIAWAKAYSSQAEANSTGEEIKKLRSVFAIDGKEVRGLKPIFLPISFARKYIFITS